MTYCVAIRLDTGLVFASDSRTSAGVDDISIYSKMHRFETTSNRVIVLLSAGNLATTQAVRNQLQRDLENPQAERSLNVLAHLDEIANYVGDISRMIQESVTAQAEQHGGFSTEASFILGGQIEGGPHDLFLIYPQGNYIAASTEKPFMQIGETKYGKPILDRIITADIRLERAARCALVSMDAAMRSNLTVGPPIELLLYRAGALEVDHYMRFDEGDEYLIRLTSAWAEGLNRTFLELPKFEWE